MRNGKAVRFFLAENRAPAPDAEKKRADMDLFREQVRHLPVCRKKKIPVRMWETAAFIHPVSWVLQMLFLLCGIYWAKWYGGKTAVTGIAAIVPLFTAVGGYELSKAVFYQMWELEKSCRYDTRSVAEMKLLLFGMCDLAALTVFSLLVYGESGDFLQVCFLVLMPFNVSSGVYLFLLEQFPARNGNVLLIGAGGMMSAVQILFRQDWERLTAALETAGTGLVLAASLLFLAGMIVRYCREREREDRILWNLD